MLSRDVTARVEDNLVLPDPLSEEIIWALIEEWFTLIGQYVDKGAVRGEITPNGDHVGDGRRRSIERWASILNYSLQSEDETEQAFEILDLIGAVKLSRSAIFTRVKLGGGFGLGVEWDPFTPYTLKIEVDSLEPFNIEAFDRWLRYWMPAHIEYNVKVRKYNNEALNVSVMTGDVRTQRTKTVLERGALDD